MVWKLQNQGRRSRNSGMNVIRLNQIRYVSSRIFSEYSSDADNVKAILSSLACVLSDLGLTLAAFATAHFAGVSVERSPTMNRARYAVLASWVSFHHFSAECACVCTILSVWDLVLSLKPSTAMCVRLVQNITLNWWPVDYYNIEIR